MRDRYVALIYPPAAGSAWGVTFPDLPGCTSAGDGYEDAVDHAAEALAGHVAALLADGDPVPLARNYDQLQQDEEFLQDVREGALPAMIGLVNVPAPKERVNIMIDRGVLRLVDHAAKAEGISRSAYIERAAASWTSSPFRGNEAKTTELIGQMLAAEQPHLIDKGAAVNDGPAERRRRA